MKMYSFDPKCPKCGSPNNIDRILDSTELLCAKCHMIFSINEIKSRGAL